MAVGNKGLEMFFSCGGRVLAERRCDENCRVSSVMLVYIL